MVRNRHKRSGIMRCGTTTQLCDEGRACPVTGFRGTPGIRGLGGLTGGGLRLWRLANSRLCGTGRGYGRDRRFWSTGRPAGHHGRRARRPGLGLLGLNHSLLLGAVADGHGTHRCGCGCRWTRTRPRPGNGPSSSGSRPSRSPAGSGSRSPASAKWLASNGTSDGQKHERTKQALGELETAAKANHRLAVWPKGGRTHE